MALMTSYERVLAVINKKEPDRVPHFEWFVDTPIVKSLTRGGTYEDLVELLDIDAVVAGADYDRRDIGSNLIVDEWGITKAQGLMEHRIPIDEKAPIKTMRDFKNWVPPDPLADGRLEKIKRYLEKYKGKRAVFIYVRDVWSLPRELMGYMDLMIACKAKPELVTGIIEKSIEHNLIIVEQAVKFGAEFVFSGDDIADNRSTLISPKMWEDLFAPHFKRLITAFHQLGLKHWKHSDGNLMPIMDSFINAGIDGIDPIDPLGGMSLSLMKQKYGKKIAIKGNVNCTTTLVNASKKELIDEVKNCIKIAGPGGGYVCSSSNSIHAGVKPDLYYTMVHAIHKYGVYPLCIE